MNPNLKAFLDMLAYSEGTSRCGDQDGYNILVGSTPWHPITFEDYSEHPNILNERCNSTAAGRYQLLYRYWAPYKKLLHLRDFGPESQDLIAIQQIIESRALAAIEAGLFDVAVSKCKHIWASLPGAGYGQHENNLGNLRLVYTQAGGRLTA